MDAQLLLQERLKQRLVETKSRNSNISIRSFARHLGLPAGTVSLVLLGKRKISLKLAEKLATALQFDPNERALLQAELKKKSASTSSTQTSTHERSRSLGTTFKPETLRLSDPQFDLLKEWYYFGILSLVQTKNFKLDAQWIAKRLNLLPSTAQAALDQLISLKLIVVENGKAKRNYRHVRTSDGSNQAAIKRAHEQNLELAKKAMRIRDYHECDFTSINLPANPQDLPAMKEMIRDFEKAFLEKFAYQAEASEVFRVNIQAFPITHAETKNVPSKDERSAG